MGLLTYYKDRGSSRPEVAHATKDGDAASFLLPGIPCPGIVVLVGVFRVIRPRPSPSSVELFMKEVVDIGAAHVKISSGQGASS